jgi:hypothetical protein
MKLRSSLHQQSEDRSAATARFRATPVSIQVVRNNSLPHHATPDQHFDDIAQPQASETNAVKK